MECDTSGDQMVAQNMHAELWETQKDKHLYLQHAITNLQLLMPRFKISIFLFNIWLRTDLWFDFNS